jgi:uncharacterized protein YqfA (UPF0365 family)
VVEFLRQPPEWMLVLLWASFFLVVLRLVSVLVPALPTYIQAKVTNTPISFAALVSLQRAAGRYAMARVVRAWIVSYRRQLGVSFIELEALQLSGDNIDQVVVTLAAARRAGLSLSWQEVVAMRRDGQDVLGVVQEAAETKNTDKLEFLKSRVKHKAGRV